MTKPTNAEEYIAQFPVEVQLLLAEIREIIRQAAPEAEEVISYSMPAFKQKGVLVWYAAYAKHIGFYPSSTGIEAFKEELSAYKWSKGAIQFPLDKPLPFELIRRIVAYRISYNLEKAKK